jgi:hypothetical protein
MIGARQWMVTVEHLDFSTAVMTMFGFIVAPRTGHLQRVKSIYGYLSKKCHLAICVCNIEPGYSNLLEVEHDWSQSVYGEISELISQDTPEPLGKMFTLTHYLDINLMHHTISGRSVTGILHMINMTPLDWYSQKQATVEMATYGSEFVAALIWVEQIIDLWKPLGYLGVPINSKSYMFGNNKSVVARSMQVYAKLHKHHHMLLFQRVCEEILSGIIGVYYIPGGNPQQTLWIFSNMVSNHSSLEG